jgi:vacuolar iron transporter family protein
MALEDVYQRNLHHRTHRAGWLRAAVLGANDGLVSTASLMIGVAAARAGDQSFLVTAGAAGIAAGAMSMAVGEYVSVRSQNDIEESDRLLEIEHLAIDPEGEFEELVEIYMKRGLSRELAVQVVDAMHKRDPLEAHLRDELRTISTYKGASSSGSSRFGMSFTAGGPHSIRWSICPNTGCGSHQHRGLHNPWPPCNGNDQCEDCRLKASYPNLARDWRRNSRNGHHGGYWPSPACEWHLKHPLATLLHSALNYQQ